jgi:cyclic lactone autoinducer peptide
MRIKNFLARHGSSLMAFALAVIAGQVAARGCFYCYYQPEEPEGLKKFVRNK